MKETKFSTLTIRHPHSGEISRSKVRTLLINSAHVNMPATDSEIARQWIDAHNGADIAVIEDANNNYRVSEAYSSIESQYDNV